MWCSTFAFLAISRPLACAAAFVGAVFETRVFPSTLLAQPSPCGTVCTSPLLTAASFSSRLRRTTRSSHANRKARKPRRALRVLAERVGAAVEQPQQQVGEQ